MKHLLLGLALLCLFTSPSQASTTKSGNFTFEPLVLLAGMVNLDVDFPVGENWSIGPDITYYSASVTSDGIDSINVKSYGIGVRGNWYANGVYTTGLYLSPVVQFVSATATVDDVSASASGVGLTGIVGYHWFWDSFNLALGGGLGGLLGTSKVKVEENGNTTEVDMTPSATLTLDFMLGWTF